MTSKRSPSVAAIAKQHNTLVALHDSELAVVSRKSPNQKVEAIGQIFIIKRDEAIAQ